MLVRPWHSLASAGAEVRAEANWFLKRMMVNLLNPKVGTFYVSFLPQFIPSAQPLVVWTFGLVSIHVAIGLLWSVIYRRDPANGRCVAPEKVIKWMDRATGMAFVLFAARLALSRR